MQLDLIRPTCCFQAQIFDPDLLDCLAEVDGAFGWSFCAVGYDTWLIGAQCFIDERSMGAFLQECSQAVRDSARAKALLELWEFDIGVLDEPLEDDAAVR